MNHHTHVTEKGMLVKCYHNCKSVMLSLGFWVGLTLGYPLEHFIWEKLWPFYLISKFFGLLAH